jgi:transposase-like protein
MPALQLTRDNEAAGPHLHRLARFVCTACRRRFNERTGTLFNDLQYPTDIVLSAGLWRLRYKLSLRDVAELLLVRSFAVTHETVSQWEARFAPLLADRLRERRRGRRSVSWYLDETWVKVAGRWRYLYRAIDRDGNLLDSMLSEHRDRGAARRFLRLSGPNNRSESEFAGSARSGRRSGAERSKSRAG